MSTDKDLNLSDLPGQVPEELAATLAGGGKGGKDGGSFWGLSELLGFGEADSAGEMAPKDVASFAASGKDRVGILPQAGAHDAGQKNLVGDNGTKPQEKSDASLPIPGDPKAGKDASNKGAPSGSEKLAEGKPVEEGLKPRSQSALDKPSADAGKAAPSETKDRSKSVSGTQADSSSKPDASEGRDRSASAPAKLADSGDKNAKEAVKPAEKTKAEKFQEDWADEAGKIPGKVAQKAASAVYDAKASENLAQAKKEGGYVSTGSMTLGEDVKPKAVTTTDSSADGKTTTTTTTTKGGYEGGYAGAMAYAVAGGVGAGVATGFEAGYGSRTVVKVDRFGGESETIETWGEVSIKGGVSAEAHANMAGVGAKVSVKTEFGAEGGIKVTAYDPATGLTYTKQGKVSAGFSADASAQAQITWERMTVSAKAGVMVKADAELYGSVKTQSGIGAGLTGAAGVWAGANAESSATVSWGAEGYKAGTKVDATVDFGAKLGIAPELATGVSKLVVGIDALYGSAGAKVDLDMGYKDGKFSAKIDLKGALGMGYNLKFNAEVDVKKWGDNIDYNNAVTFKDWGLANYIPHVKVLQSLYSMFEGAPEVTYIESFAAPKVPWNQISNFVVDNIPGVKQEDAAKFFIGALTQYARADFLQAEVKEWSNKSTGGTFYKLLPFSGEGKIFKDGKEYADAVKARNEFFGRDGTDPASFTLTPGKNFVHDVSERLQKWFPASKDPNVEAMELTFKKLPDRFDQAFRFKMDSNGKQQGIEPQSAFQIFAGLSLVQYLSVQAFEKIAPMSKGEVQRYLASSDANYITDEGKVKLLKLWDDSLPARLLGQPSAQLFNVYMDGPGAHLTPEVKAQLTATWQTAYKADQLGNVYQKQQIAENRPDSFNNIGRPLDTADVRYEAKFWELAKSSDIAEVKQAKFKEYESQFKNDFLKTFQFKFENGMTSADWKVIGVPDNQLLPADKIKFKGIPPSDNGYLIDLMPAKTGQIGLNDLIYKHTLAKLDMLKSPQAALQFLTGPKGDYIADDASRMTLFKAWWAENKDGEWRKASDPDAVKARQWCDQNREILSKYSGEDNPYWEPKPLFNPEKPIWHPDNVRHYGTSTSRFGGIAGNRA